MKTRYKVLGQIFFSKKKELGTYRFYWIAKIKCWWFMRNCPWRTATIRAIVKVKLP